MWLISIGALGKHQLWMGRSWWLEIFHHPYWTATTCTTSLTSSWMSVGSSSGRISRTTSSATFSTWWAAPSDFKIFSKKSNWTSPTNIMRTCSSSTAALFRWYFSTSTRISWEKQASQIKIKFPVLPWTWNTHNSSPLILKNFHINR